MDSNEDFDWAWAEREESLAALQDSLTEFYQTDPLYELLWLCFNSPSETIAIDLRDAAALRCPSGFPRLAEGCDLLQACCQNIEVEHALTWLQFCLDNASFDPEQLSRALAQGCWRGWFLGERSLLAERLLQAGANARQSSPAGDCLLLSLFRAWDDPDELPFSGSMSSICEALLISGADPQHRNKCGESPLSRLNLRLAETLLGMDDEIASSDLLRCAQLLLDHGADSASVREAPPLEMVVPHAALRGMIQGAEEKAAIGDFLSDQSSSPASHQTTSASRNRGSSRL